MDFCNGLYHGKRPQQAALKAFNRYCTNVDLQTCRIKFTIEEVTKNSKRKKYTYIGDRQKLQTPKEIKLDNGFEYTVKYKSIVKKYK